jgi:hypothetical protein
MMRHKSVLKILPPGWTVAKQQELEAKGKEAVTQWISETVCLSALCFACHAWLAGCCFVAAQQRYSRPALPVLPQGQGAHPTQPLHLLRPLVAPPHTSIEVNISGFPLPLNRLLLIELGLFVADVLQTMWALSTAWNTGWTLYNTAVLYHPALYLLPATGLCMRVPCV